MSVKSLFFWLNLLLLLLPLMAQSQQQVEMATASERQQLQQQLAQSTDPTQRLTLLVRLTEVFVTQDPALSLSYATKWLELSTDRESADYHRVLLQQTTAYMLLGNYQKAYQSSLETERLARTQNDTRQLFNALRRQADNLNRLGQSDKALPKALEAMQIAIDANNAVPLQIIRYDLAFIYLNLYAYPQAIQIASDGLDLAMTGDDSNRQANFLHLLAEASRLYQQYQAAEDFARKALELRLSRQEQALVALYHLSLARSLLPQRKYQESEQQLQLALLAAQQVNNAIEQADALQSLAWLDLHFGRIDQANSRYQQITQLLQTEEHQASFRRFSLLHLSDLLEFSLEQQASALYKKLALHESHFSEPQLLLDYWQVTAQVAHFNQQYQQAYKALDQLRQLQQSLFDDKTHKQALVISSEQHKSLLERDLQQASQQNQLDKLNHQHQKNMLILFSVGACLALALLLSLFYHKSRRNRLLLQKQQEMAQQKIAVKNEFIATLGHEIRTPLQGIDAVLAQVLPEIEQQSSQQKIQLARRSVWSLDNIINNILTSSRLDYGVYQPVDQQVVLAELLGRLHDLLEPLASNKGLKLSCSLASNVPGLLLLDENLLTQLLTNLISNAVKYTKQGEIEVRVELLNQKDSRLQLLFKVRDTGVGLTTIQVSQLLRGERLNQQRTLQAGPGLGMLVCQKLLQQLGSALDIQSVPGFGTEVSFSLQCQASALLPVTPAAATEQHHALVVEDDELCRLSLEQVLTELGFEVTTASSLLQVKQLPQQLWSWVFLDGQLEDADALQSIQQLEQQHQVDEQSRFVLVTGSASAQTLPQISALLSKPWRREQLQALIAQLAQLPPLKPLYQIDYLQQALLALNTEQRRKLKANVQQQLATLQHELTQATPDPKVFHRLIGSMGQLGLMRLSQLCRLMEQQLHQNKKPEPWLNNQLQQCLQQSQQALMLLFERYNQQ
ncbi:MAG: response regulator [Gammaproteobacteria bacterium]|nr:response regulator [Gammaproteobacteria bacterium]MBU2059422.1 response regulator [Gammaproteobacteria bacterium]MBU2175198.1 response regulator [Gammaproteobacteria bacterium]MBU2247406.1 response regulator [Gammaproteobacteria bacterium]MBU2683227.1 response regulator [Gammaproteobacteria bacterium]